MAEGKESRFVCKLCCKKFPSGKSLGGHMRSHVVANSAEFGEKVELLRIKENPFVNVNESKFGESGNGQSGYGLRDNPRKTWRAADSWLPSVVENVCKQCGKGFQSKKALCGHMACHSDKEKGSYTSIYKDNNSWTSENEKMVLDGQSDIEGEERRVGARSSKSKKWEPSVMANNGSSSVSEIDDQEQEEMAKCLMMLSRDFGSKGGVNSVVESSDNNSVVVETKSSSNEMRISRKGSVYDHVNEVKKLGDGGLDDETAKMEDSDSGYFLDECAKDESDVSFDWFRRNGGFSECKKLGNDGVASKCGGIESRKRKYGSENARMVRNGGELGGNPQKKSKYECCNCGKVFKSYHALGGHRPCNRRSMASSESRGESGENTPDAAAYFLESSSKRKASGKSSAHLAEKKTKNKNEPQACPFCDRVFKNGQALGGHKRSHFLIGQAETNKNTSPVEKQELVDLLDLNLPAPEADQDEDGSQFFSN